MTIMVNPLQPFQVIAGPAINQDRLWSLTHLYQPIMGTTALSVYLTLNSFENNPNKESLQVHHHLQELLNIGIQEYNQARQRLESLYLLDSYLDPNSHPDVNHQLVLYKVKEALSLDDFLNQPILNTALFNQMGESRYLALVDRSKSKDFGQESYQKINSNFSQAFYRINTERFRDKLVKGDNKAEIQVVYSGDFNYSKFLSFIMADGINHSLLTKQLKDQVYALHQLYHFNESEMAQLIFQALSPDKNQLDYQVLLKLSSQKTKDFKSEKQEIQSSERNVFPRVLNKEQLEERKVQLASKYANLSQGDIHLILSCEQIPNGSFLYKIKHQKQGFVGKNEAQYLENILKISQLHPAIINFMIYYLLIIEDHPSLYNGHLQNLANEWQQAGLKNVAEVILFTKNKKQKSSHGSKTKSKNYQEVVPDWMKEELVSPTQPELATNPEAIDLEANEKALREKLDNLFKGGKS